MDGAFCDYTEKEKMSYIHHLERSGVTNIEMESLAFAALTHHAGIRAAVICVSLLDRIRGDQVHFNLILVLYAALIEEACRSKVMNFNTV